MGDEISLQGAHGRDRGASSRAGARDVRGVRDQDSEGGGEQGPRAYSDELSAEHGAERDHATDQGSYLGEAVRRVSACEEALLGPAFLGEGVFLRHRRSNDGKR